MTSAEVVQRQSPTTVLFLAMIVIDGQKLVTIMLLSSGILIVIQ